MKKIYILLLFVTYISATFAQQKIDELIKQGIDLHDNNQYVKAIQKYAEALEINPNSEEAIYEMAFSYLELKQYEYAIKLAKMLYNSQNKELAIGAVCIQSEALVYLDKTDMAIDVLKQGILKIGDDYQLHFNLALNYYKKNDIDNTLLHVSKAIDLNKTNSGAFLLNAYALNDKGLWVQSILSFQMFLLLEPDSNRSKNAFQEMLQTMQIIEVGQTPVERSFYQLQMMKNQSQVSTTTKSTPALTMEQDLDRNQVFQEIKKALDKLKASNNKASEFDQFIAVNKALFTNLKKQHNKTKNDNTFWTFYVPFFTEIADSKYFETYCRYISVSYFPESIDWWNINKEEKGKKFLNWFEQGDSDTN